MYGLKPAVDDLEQIFVAMGNEQGEVFEALGYSGVTCVRLVRGSSFRISNHSWGIAIDLNPRGVLDTPADDRVQRGLALAAPNGTSTSVRLGFHTGLSLAPVIAKADENT